MGGAGMTFRIFTNDRGKQDGVFMYSAWRDIEAHGLAHAQSWAEEYGRDLAYRGEHGPVKAIEWPATSQLSKDWLAKHV